ncbi:Proteasome subunit alpha type-2-A [Arachis hypogaea]|nr:Proteasome subunit alpha type-2-A [Arachis hypogaea]
MFVASSHPIGRSRRLPLTTSRRSRGLSLLQSSSTSTWLQVDYCSVPFDFRILLLSPSPKIVAAILFFSLMAKLVARCSACSPWPPFEEAANGVVIATEKTLPSILVDEASISLLFVRVSLLSAICLVVQKIQLLTPNIGVV